MAGRAARLWGGEKKEVAGLPAADPPARLDCVPYAADRKLLAVGLQAAIPPPDATRAKPWPHVGRRRPETGLIAAGRSNCSVPARWFRRQAAVNGLFIAGIAMNGQPMAEGFKLGHVLPSTTGSRSSGRAGQNVVELAGRLDLKRGQDVRVGVQRYADLRMAQSLLDDLRMTPADSKSVADVCRRS